MATVPTGYAVEGERMPSAPANHNVKEIFEVLGDISNAANEYLLRGFDAFERYGKLSQFSSSYSTCSAISSWGFCLLN